MIFVLWTSIESSDEEHRMMFVCREEIWSIRKNSQKISSQIETIINNSISTLAQAETFLLNTSLIWTNSLCKLLPFLQWVDRVETHKKKKHLYNSWVMRFIRLKSSPPSRDSIVFRRFSFTCWRKIPLKQIEVFLLWLSISKFSIRLLRKRTFSECRQTVGRKVLCTFIDHSLSENEENFFLTNLCKLINQQQRSLSVFQNVFRFTFVDFHWTIDKMRTVVDRSLLWQRRERTRFQWEQQSTPQSHCFCALFLSKIFFVERSIWTNKLLPLKSLVDKQKKIELFFIGKTIQSYFLENDWTLVNYSTIRSLYPTKHKWICRLKDFVKARIDFQTLIRLSSRFDLFSIIEFEWRIFASERLCFSQIVKTLRQIDLQRNNWTFFSSLVEFRHWSKCEMRDKHFSSVDLSLLLFLSGCLSEAKICNEIVHSSSLC